MEPAGLELKTSRMRSEITTTWLWQPLMMKMYKKLGLIQVKCTSGNLTFVALSERTKEFVYNCVIRYTLVLQETALEWVLSEILACYKRWLSEAVFHQCYVSQQMWHKKDPSLIKEPRFRDPSTKILQLLAFHGDISLWVKNSQDGYLTVYNKKVLHCNYKIIAFGLVCYTFSR
jgi:hypothetical protein